jgi:hypothetical protein
VEKAMTGGFWVWFGLGLIGIIMVAAAGWWHGSRRAKPEPSSQGLEGMLQEWLGDIIKDPKFSTEVLLDHLIHHIEEGRREGVSESWLASMQNLLDLCAMRQRRVFKPSTQKRLERLYQHWQKDPQNMTPPPQMKSFARVVEQQRQAQPPQRYVAGEPS